MMHRLAAAVTALVLAGTTTAMAAGGYRQGPYSGGDASRANQLIPKHPGVLIDVRGTQFVTFFVLLPERCTHGVAAPYVFLDIGAAPGDPLSGSVQANGSFSAMTVDAGGRGKTTIRGKLDGRRGSVTVTDRGPSGRNSKVICHGSDTFQLRSGPVRG